jgi:hypothetical protein
MTNDSKKRIPRQLKKIDPNAATPEFDPNAITWMSTPNPDPNALGIGERRPMGRSDEGGGQ